MIAAKSMDVRDNFKLWCSQAANGEVIQISRPGNNYVYLINQETYEKVTMKNRLTDYMSYLNGKDKITNLKRLSEIGNLQDNWNNNGAESIPEDIIKKVRKLILSLDYQPEIFPTACDSLQLEWDKKNGEYLEMEVLENSIHVFQISTDGSEKQWMIEVEEVAVNEVLRGFYDR